MLPFRNFDAPKSGKVGAGSMYGPLETSLQRTDCSRSFFLLVLAQTLCKPP